MTKTQTYQGVEYRLGELIEWDAKPGKVCPVPKGAMVTVWDGNGRTYKIEAGAILYAWSATGGERITAYLIHSLPEEAPEPVVEYRTYRHTLKSSWYEDGTKHGTKHGAVSYAQQFRFCHVFRETRTPAHNGNPPTITSELVWSKDDE